MHDPATPAEPVPLSPAILIPALGIVQIFMWGTTAYLPAVIAPAIVAEQGWSLAWVVGGMSVGLTIAGLISPKVGRVIERRGGRPVLALSSLLTAAGLAILAAAPSLPVYMLGWIVMGTGMGTGLYDAVFAALGRLYGQEARGAVTNLTLFGGFASFVCWPLSAYLVAHWDWRVACLAYAAFHLVVGLPVHLLVFPEGRARSAGASAAARAAASADSLAPRERNAFLLLAAAQVLAQAIGWIVIVHLLTFLQARGLTHTEAVGLGALFGPAQVGARVVERVFGYAYHPIWTMIAATLAMAAGLSLLLVDLPIVVVAVVIYGAGYGVTWIARGTLPLAIFGAERYPVLIGRLALPSLMAQALAPFLGALLIERLGMLPTLTVLTAVALANVAVVLALWRLCRAEPAGASM